MTKNEFIELTRLIPTDEEYEEIERAYYAVPNLDKRIFCDCWLKIGDNILTHLLAKQVSVLDGMNEERLNELESCRKDRYELAEFLLGKASAYDDTDFYKKAVKLVGKSEAVKIKCRMGLPLWEEDVEYITKNL